VYDITAWFPSHPGGQDSLRYGAGRDITEIFLQYHPTSALGVLSKYQVGVLSTRELPVFDYESSSFYPDLKARIYGYFREKKLDSKHYPTVWLRYLFAWTVVAVAFYFQNTLGAESFWIGAMFAALHGYGAAFSGFHCLHDSCHFAITHNPLVWKVLGYFHDCLIGVSNVVWTYQHVFGHHPYTNIDGADPDIQTAEVDMRRIKKWQKWFSPYVFQHLYAPVLYGFLVWKNRISDFDILFGNRMNGSIRVNRLTREQVVCFWLAKTFWFVTNIVIPLQYLPISTLCVYMTISDFFISYYLALTFQANHVVDEVIWPRPDPKTMVVPMDWAEMQMKTTQDYGHGNWFVTFFSGALNYQVTHHLFPGIQQIYYPEIAPIVKEVAAEHGIEYLCLDGLKSAVSSHFSFLKEMGSGKDLTTSETKKSN